ncbi:filamentous hemagglutinin N-terminal domain-containing protein, partial [Rodentibacter pneumotropicus]
MNKNHYKVIFSRVLCQLVVVSELAKSQGKAASENLAEAEIKTTSNPTVLSCLLNPIHFSLMLALGFVYLAPTNVLASPEMAIRADKSAPGNQQPTVLQTANELPQVNIQTPSAGGVSRNQYSQFDVAEKGAVLNNARKATQTQMAGWVQGNPNLARGEAKVILNEVNSTNPSRLKGYVEVAGKKADVVIANPSGIHCEGCGVINAGRATLTTGKVQLENGKLKGFDVRGGEVRVSGKGMNNAQSDYTDIIAEKVKIDGGVWAKKGINVTTGKNKVNRTNDSVVYVGNKNAAKNDRTLANEVSNQTDQTYAVDVSRLGGMYAERIHLVDNGSGLGVRNAGHIGASTGNVRIDSQGRVVNSGTISATQQAHINSSKTIENTGKIETKQGDIALRSQKNIDQKGSMVSRQSGVSLQAKETITQTGETVSKGNIAYQAKQIKVKNSALIAAGVSVQDTVQGEIRRLDQQNLQGDVTISATDAITSNAKHLASGTIKIKSNAVDLSESQLSANRVAIQSTRSPLKLNQATLYSEDHIELASPNAISTNQANLNAGHFEVDTAKLNNQQGSWIQRSTETFSLNLKDGLDNTQGKMAVEGELSIQSPSVQNRQGVLWSNNRLSIDTKAGHIDSQSGYLFGKHNIDIHSATLNNQQGEILGEQVSLSGRQVNNEKGKIIAGNKANLSVNQLNNQHQGIVYSKGELALNVKNLLNQEGIISALSQAVLNAEHIDNRQGVLQVEDDFTIRTNTINNEQGDILAKDAEISAAETNNAKGVITAKNSLTLSGSLLDNRGGIVQAKQTEVNLTQLDNRANGTKGSLLAASNRLVLNVANINNQQTKASQSTPTQGIQAGEVIINAERLDNQRGGIYVGKSVNLSVNQSLNNQQGEILSTGRVDITNPNFTLVVDNTLGLIESLSATTLQAKTLINESSINTKGDLNIALKDSFTLNQAFGVGNNLTFSTKGNFINNTHLVVGNRASIQGETIQNNANAEISSGHTDIQGKKVDNLGLIDGDTTVITASEVNNLGVARIYGTQLAIQAEALNNLENAEGQSATIAARERLDLGVGELVNRNHSLIMSLGTLHIGGKLDENHQTVGYAKRVDNASATVESLGNAWIRSHHLLNHDLHLKLGEYHTDERIVEYAPKDSSKRYIAKNKDGGEGYFYLKNNNKHDSNSYFILKDGSSIASRYWTHWNYNRHTVTTTIEQRDPARLLIGGDLQLQGNDLENNASTLAVGNRLFLADTLITSNEKNRDLTAQGITLKNIDIIGTINRTDKGNWDSFGKEHTRYGWKGKKRWAVYETGKGSFEDKHPVEHFNFNKVLNTIGRPVDGSGAQVDNKTDFQGISLAQKTPLEADLKAKSINLENITSGVMKNQDNLGIKTHLPDISLPQASLYKINPQSGTFLIETDPRFTDRTKWLSSDYMFNALRSDPQNLLKRLGDGFYEQRLVNEQINRLTGRRFLENYHSDYEQYKALMDNGAYYAKKWQLVPGVALTAMQMKELTTDMVWMVKKDVILKDGRKIEVLAPQVYIVARNSDIDSQGAVISA